MQNDLILHQRDASGVWVEKTVTAVAGQALAFGASGTITGSAVVDTSANNTFAGQNTFLQGINVSGKIVTASGAGNNVYVVGRADGHVGGIVIGHQWQDGLLNRGANSIDIACLRGDGTEIASGTNAILIGRGKAHGTSSIAIGSYTTISTNGVNSISIGTSASANGTNGIAIGVSSSLGTDGDNSLAIGAGASTSQHECVVIGDTATSSANYGNAIGYHATVGATYAQAFGRNAIANGQYAIAIGDASSVSATESIAIGKSASAADADAIVIGAGSATTTADSVAIGRGISSVGYQGVAIGKYTSSSAPSAIAIGTVASAVATTSIAIGSVATANGTSSIGIGASATTWGDSSNSIGNGNTASGTNVSVYGGTGIINLNSNTAEIGPDNTYKLAVTTSGLVVPKSSNFGIRVDNVAPTWGWRDLEATEIVDIAGANQPALVAYRGGLVRENAYSVSDKTDMRFHIPHDWVSGTDLYLHVHWSHNGTSLGGAFSGNATFTYAKGHNQANFSVEKTLPITYNTVDITATPQYRHRIDEVQLSIVGGSATQLDSSAIEPDGLILLNYTQGGIPAITGGSPNEPFVHRIDIHYQSTNIGTKNRVTGFYA